jgi:hypothetical protein
MTGRDSGNGAEVDPSDVLDKMVYALTNAVKDNLVPKVAEWPGVNSFDSTMTVGRITTTRPDILFREDGPMPRTVTLTFHRPPELANMTAKEFEKMVSARVEAAKADAAAPRRPTGIRVLGRLGVRDQVVKTIAGLRSP